jgi:tRNA-Thr(GGU) m(6)t(6)A37 methyltransferase TsaA
MSDDLTLRPVGVVRSPLRDPAVAPMQGYEGALDAWIEIHPAFAQALTGIAEGDDVIVLTWLHLARRDVLEVHPRGDPRTPLAGVFSTRSPDRPNPIGLHRVAVLEIAPGPRVRVRPLEAVDGTPVIDIKPVLPRSADA